MDWSRPSTVIKDHCFYLHKFKISQGLKVTNINVTIGKFHSEKEKGTRTKNKKGLSRRRKSITQVHC